MTDENYFEYVSGREAEEAVGAMGVCGVHSVTDRERTGEAIDAVAGYFHNPGTLAYRLKQSYPSEEAREAFEGLAFLRTEGSKNLVKLSNLSHDLSKLKEIFGLSDQDQLEIGFEADMSHGPNPINLVNYRLSEEGEQFNQYLLFSSPTGDETTPLYLGEIEEIFDRAEAEDFNVRREGLERLRQAIKNRYDFDSGEELMKENMAYFDESIRNELVRLIFG